jgi:hypothetical protein
MPAAFEWATPVSGFEWLTPFNFVEGCAVLASLFECLRRLNVLRTFLRFAV